jgi:hypothetical protein
MKEISVNPENENLIVSRQILQKIKQLLIHFSSKSVEKDKKKEL